VLGYHLEGPFLSPNKPGCHPLQNLRDAPEGWTSFVKVFGDDAVRDPDSSEADAASPPPPHCVKMITLAPELDGVGSSVSELASRGWVVSLGHSAATTSEALQAVRNGARMITHLYNAMPQLRELERCAAVLSLRALNTQTN
jgi:N-acetylglucosamine-6-phosphate deacetylase